MANLHSPQGTVNRKVDSGAERDLLLNSLRLAATRARLKVSIFDSFHVALRQGQTDCADIIRRLKDEGVLHEVPFLEAVGGGR
jgi:hypothetical protein